MITYFKPLGISIAQLTSDVNCHDSYAALRSVNQIKKKPHTHTHSNTQPPLSNRLVSL